MGSWLAKLVLLVIAFFALAIAGGILERAFQHRSQGFRRALWWVVILAMLFSLAGFGALMGQEIDKGSRMTPIVSALAAMALGGVLGVWIAKGAGHALAGLLVGAGDVDDIPEHPQLGAAQAARKRGNLAEAERLLREAIARRPDHVDARAELGDVLAEAERPAEAAAELAEASRGVDDVDRALRLGFRAAELWERAGDQARALAALDDLAARVRGTPKAELVAARRARLRG